MPGTPPTSTIFAIPRYSSTDVADYPTQTNAIVDQIDSQLGAHKSRHEPGGSDALTALTSASFASANIDGTAATASLRTLGTGAQQACAGNDSRLSGAARVKREVKTWATDVNTAPVVGAGQIVACFPVSLAAAETVTLIGAYIRCATVGATASVFKVQTDTGSHGTLADVTGLTALTVAAGAFILTSRTGGPLSLAEGDAIAIVCVTPGTSVGCSVGVVEEHTS
jgi:hypothetical protein